MKPIIFSTDMVKAILDRECYEKLHAKQCSKRFANLKHIQTPCWMCHTNDDLARELVDSLIQENIEDG